jgi:hypothetical protein
MQVFYTINFGITVVSTGSNPANTKLSQMAIARSVFFSFSHFSLNCIHPPFFSDHVSLEYFTHNRY